MAEKKKFKGIPFKELPVYCKIIRIITSVLLLLGATQTLIGAILMINNPYLWGISIGALGFLIPALVLAIVEMNLEKKILARREAEGGTQPQPTEDKKVESQPVPKSQDNGWYCPNCGAHNTGKFCSKCGTKKPEVVNAKEPEVVAEKEPDPVVEEPAEEVKPVKAEPVEVETAKTEEPKKSKKGLIIGLAAGGGALLLIGAIVGGIFGVRAIINAAQGRSGGESESKDSLPSNYEFTIPYGTVSYETDSTTTGFVFYGDIDGYPELKNTVRVYEWCWSNYYNEYRYYELKFGTFTYTKSTQTINVTLDRYQCYNTSWNNYYFEVPEELTFKIKSETKMIYSASNIYDTVVKKVSYFTNSTSKQYSE